MKRVCATNCVPAVCRPCDLFATNSLSREQIALKIWGYESDSEYNNVEVYMSFARKKLAFVGSACEIKALRGIGYELRRRDVR